MNSMMLLCASLVSLSLLIPFGGWAKPAPACHLKVLIPSLPYLYIMHSINGALRRLANKARGWDYDMATSHRKLAVFGRVRPDLMKRVSNVR